MVSGSPRRAVSIDRVDFSWYLFLQLGAMGQVCTQVQGPALCWDPRVSWS